MYKINDYVVYKREVCKIIDIKEKYYKNMDYYILSPINDNSLKIQIPKDNNLIRPLITKKEITELIKKIPSIEIIQVNDKLLETEYKNKMKTETFEDLISIIKTTYLRNKERLENKKKVADIDNKFYLLACSYLYTEVSFSLGITYKEAEDYIIKEVSKLESKV